MGFNIAGLAINQNYQGREEDLWRALGFNLEFQEAIYFETASANWKEEEICDVYFTESGTLLFLSMDRCIEGYSISDHQCFTFALSETSMAFNFEYAEGTRVLRRFMEVNGEELSSEGALLEIEQTAPDSAEKIWGQMEKVLGMRFWDIAPDAKAFRYRFRKATTNNAPKVTELKSSSNVSNDLLTSADDNLATLFKTMEEKKDQKFRFGRFSLLFFQEEDFTEVELEKIQSHPSFVKIERFKNFSKGPAYIVTMKTKSLGFFGSLLDLVKTKH